MKTTALTRYGLRQLKANRTRLGLTSFAIVLSVAFMTAAFVLGGGYSAAIYGWGESQSSGLDLLVEPTTSFQALNFEVNPARVDDATLAAVRNTPGVSDARPALWTDNRIRPELPGGDLVSDRFAVTTRNWDDGGPLLVTAGTPPSAGQFTIDHDTAANNDYVIGDAYGVTTPTGTRTMVLSGLTDFRQEAGTTAGQVLLTFDLQELQDALGERGYVRLDVNNGPDASVEELEARLERAVPEGVDVLTKEEFEDRLRKQVSPFAKGFRFGLIGFALVSVFVSAFIIYNTFTMLMSQRTREIGLLRAVGASPRQIRRSTRNEAMLLGTTASVVGIGAGLGLTHLLSAMLRAAGGLPDPDLSLSLRVVVGSLAVGVGMTYLAAAGPARRASGLPVMEALSDGLAPTPKASGGRFVTGVCLSVVGALVVGAGVAGTGSPQVTLLAMVVGALTIFLGIALLNPLWLTPVSKVLGWPLACFGGVAGRLARQNISRNTRRSATTAASLMIGLALVSLVLVVGQSVKDQVGVRAASAYNADYIVANQYSYKYPLAISDDLRRLDAVATTTALSFDPVAIDGDPQYLTVVDTAELQGLVDFSVDGGAFDADPSGAPVWVTAAEASEQNLSVGDPVSVTFFNGAEASLRVAGIYSNAAGQGNYLIDRATWFEHTGQTTVDVIVIQSADGVSAESFRTTVTQFEAANAQVRIESIAAYVETAGDGINQALGVVNALMGLAILISFLGIANTVALSTFERTREIGLLKAVGMKRRQLRRMIRYEAALISAFGSLIGTGIGCAFGAASVAALPSSFAGKLSIPVGQIIGLLGLSVLAGVAAASLPAWRAAKVSALDLLSG